MSYSSEVLADSPDVYYRLDETGSGPFVDVAHAHNLTPNATIVPGATLLATDPDASAVMDFGAAFFTATSAYTLAQQPMTVEFWVKPRSLTASALGSSIVVSCSNASNGWSAKYLDTTGVWRFTTHGVKDYTFTAAAAVGVTQHVVFILQASNAVDLYINGVFQQTVTFATPMAATAAGLRVNGVAGTAFSNMQVDEVAIYKSALSAGRIAAHFAAGANLSILAPPASATADAAAPAPRIDVASPSATSTASAAAPTPSVALTTPPGSASASSAPPSLRVAVGCPPGSGTAGSGGATPRIAISTPYATATADGAPVTYTIGGSPVITAPALLGVRAVLSDRSPGVGGVSEAYNPRGVIR